MDTRVFRREEREIQILKVDGSLDAAVSRALEGELEVLLNRSGTRIIVDLAEADQIKSDGIRVLLAAAKQRQDTGSRLAICALSDPAKQVLEVSCLASLFEIYDTLSEALAGLQEKGKPK